MPWNKLLRQSLLYDINHAPAGCLFFKCKFKIISTMSFQYNEGMSFAYRVSVKYCKGSGGFNYYFSAKKKSYTCQRLSDSTIISLSINAFSEVVTKISRHNRSLQDNSN
jgi:hypothetical protein